MMQDRLAVSDAQSLESLQVEQVRDADRDAWNAFVQNSEHCTLYHHYEALQMINRMFKHEFYGLCARDSESNIVGVLPLVRLKSALFGDYMVSMPYFNYGGAIALNADVERALMESAKALGQSLGVSHIEFRDVKPRGTEWPARTDKVTMLLDLPSDSDVLWQAIGAKCRSQIKRPLREGVEVLTGQSNELIDQFYDVFSRNMRDLGTPVYGKSFFQEILATFPENVHIVVVMHQGRPVAAAFLIGFRGMMEIPWASSLREVNKIGVNMLLYWEVLKYSIEHGFKTFDFGRSTMDSGTFRFKKQWGASPQQLYWHYWLRDGGELPQLNPNNPKYKLAISVWQKLPLAVTKILGPLLVKNLP